MTVAAGLGVDVPITAMVAALVRGHITVSQAVEALLSRPVRKE